jgi:hypothetical protein
MTYCNSLQNPASADNNRVKTVMCSAIVLKYMMHEVLMLDDGRMMYS